MQNLENITKELTRTIAHMKEDMKLFNKKLDFMQDNNARIAVEQQAIAEAVRQIISVADRVLEQKKGVNPQHHGVQ
jgi:hypothetical protein